MEGEDKRGLSTRMTNVEIEKYLRDQKLRKDEKNNKEMHLMRQEMENLKEELRNRSGENSKEVRQGSDEEPLE